MDDTTYRLRTPIALRASALLAASAIAFACASPDGVPPSRFEALGDQGFSITQEVRLAGGLRSEFEEATEHIEAEEYAQAIELLEHVTEAAPHATAAFINLGIAYAGARKMEEAEASLLRAVELAPRHAAAHNELGIVYRRTGRFEEARRSYETALRIYPGFHFARRNLAILCDLFIGDLECAIEHYELYSRAVPEDESVTIWIADLRNRTGKE